MVATPSAFAISCAVVEEGRSGRCYTPQGVSSLQTSNPLIMGHADADAESSKRIGQPAQTARFKPQGASLLTASTMTCRSRRAPLSPLDGVVSLHAWLKPRRCR